MLSAEIFFLLLTVAVIAFDLLITIIENGNVYCHGADGFT